MNHESSGCITTVIGGPTPEELSAFKDDPRGELKSVPPLTVHQAWSAVMADVQAIGKDQRNRDQNFNFRGIDDVVNVVGPVLRKHGVSIIPDALRVESERYETKTGTKMVNRVVEMRYTVQGPAGDSFLGSVFGESADSGDKAIAKAQSVAYRTFLLQALTIPTDEPDPNPSSHERVARTANQELVDQLRAAVDLSSSPRDGAAAWFYKNFGCNIAEAEDGALRTAIKHFEMLRTGY